MKKILTTILFIFIVSCSIFAAERPRWVSMPIYVYIPQYGNMSVLMKQAFLAWQNSSKNLVRFSFTPSPNNANIVVEFVDFVSNCSSPEAVGCCEMSTRGGEYYKAYVTIGTKEYQRTYQGNAYVRQIVTRSKEHIYGVMLHEAGHAIGLAHSQTPNGIMYPYDLDSMQYITKDDLKLLYNKYH